MEYNYLILVNTEIFHYTYESIEDKYVIQKFKDLE